MAGEAEKKEEKKAEKKEEAPKKKKTFLLIIIAAVVVVAIGAGGFLFFKGKSAHKGAVQEANAEEEAPAAESGHGEAKGAHAEANGGHGEAGGAHGDGKGAGASGAIFSLEPFIVNLQDNSGTRYLKLTVNLELNSPASTAELTAQSTKIRDSLIILLSSKSYADIGSVEGKYQMRDEIIARVNQFLVKGKVKTAYFTEFVIQ